MADTASHRKIFYYICKEFLVFKIYTLNSSLFVWVVQKSNYPLLITGIIVNDLVDPRVAL